MKMSTVSAVAGGLGGAFGGSILGEPLGSLAGHIRHMNSKKGTKKQKDAVRRRIGNWAVAGTILGGLGGAALGATHGYRVGRANEEEWQRINDSFRGGWRDEWKKDWGNWNHYVPPARDINAAKTVLGVHGMKTKAEVISRHRSLIKEFHPDVAKDKQASHEKIININKAWDTFRSSPDFQKLASLNLAEFARLRLMGISNA